MPRPATGGRGRVLVIDDNRRALSSASCWNGRMTPRWPQTPQRRDVRVAPGSPCCWIPTCPEPTVLPSSPGCGLRPIHRSGDRNAHFPPQTQTECAALSVNTAWSSRLAGELMNAHPGLQRGRGVRRDLCGPGSGGEGRRHCGSWWQRIPFNQKFILRLLERWGLAPFYPRRPAGRG
jgi:hypothetical protein